ncbi:MAG: NAD(P)H-dependent oxidoreductase [Caulobacteraceae bacterium]|nr:NAD(P)H-dependent oxidoreductase [Caulobacteraceae bacterium]
MTTSVPARQPLIVGIGGTTRQGSTSERILAKALEAAERLGARTQLFNGPFLARLPIYDPAAADASPEAVALLEGVQNADGVVIATPGYHGSVSGLIKNALDTLEGTRASGRPYFQNLAVGCVVVADGWQACGATLSALRDIIHALRGWPTPYGVTFNPSAGRLFAEDGALAEAKDAAQIEMMVDQVMDFVGRRGAPA